MRVAAWQDLVDAARADHPDITVIEPRIALLNAMLVGAGVAPGERFGRLADILSPSEATLARDPDAVPPGWTDAQRLAAADALVREAAATGHCVAWLTFAAARLPEFVLEVGPVTFFDADWCISNALVPPWQDYPYRSELTRVIEHDHDRGIFDPYADPRHEVIARVDLGHRPSFGWKEEAVAQVRSVVGLVTVRTGAPSWRRAGFSCLVMDGEVGTYSFGPGDESLFTEPDHYGMNGFADALEDYRTELAGLLSSGPLPTDVAEALRLVGEAGQVDSRENALNGTATIAEQSVIVLQVAAMERLAAYTGMDGDPYASKLAADWPLVRYHQNLAWAVEQCLSGVGGGGDPLFHQVVSFPSGRRHLSFVTAFDVRDQLIAACPGRFERARAETLLESIGDADTALKMLASFAAEAGVLKGRLSRCRNALMHGNPVALESVQSVRGFSRFIVGTALDNSIRSIAEGRTVADLLKASDHRRRATLDALQSGRSIGDIWSTAKDGKPL
ncbi:hypothetical protein [Arthrobacter castelli]|uniref:hypothetical protein n=1 Tax=Arthrobacter castelli TaxID=271431 RepID=UPI0012DCD451|nr:hypothetical protein [Arthrobacter castelli]